MSVALAHRPPAQLARATIAHHSKSFALASRLLGTRERDQTAMVYAWCRRADDAIDHSTSPHDAREELLRLSNELRAVYLDTTRDPILAGFARVAKDRAIPKHYPSELLAGMGMDVARERYRTTDKLVQYSYRVAGVVGLMMCHVFGLRDERALVHAAHLGIAMQLTNICRDVAEDWQNNRLYLPEDILARHGLRDLADDLGGPFPATARVGVARTVADVLALADRYYASGARGEGALPFRASIAVRSARRIYAAIGRRIAEQNHDVLAGRAVVPPRTKALHVARGFARSAIELPWRALSRRPFIPDRILELGDVPRL